MNNLDFETGIFFMLNIHPVIPRQLIYLTNTTLPFISIVFPFLPLPLMIHI